MTVATKRKVYDGQEHYDLYHLDEAEFLEKYPNRNKDSMRLRKKRDLVDSTPKDNIYGLRAGFLDIETSGFKADFDPMLCAVVGDDRGELQTWRRDEFDQEHVLDDRLMAIAVRDFINEQPDYIVTWYGKMFDVPFVNTRLTLEHQERPLDIRLHIDAFYLVPQGIAGRSLKNVARALRVTDDKVFKTDFDKRIWALANAGDKAALDHVVDHCQKDVLLLARVFDKLRPLIRNIHR